MQFGIAVPTDADSRKAAQRAEELSFLHAWFYDTQMLRADCFVAMGAAAVKTSRIRLGTGVLIPSNRIAPVTAGAFTSLNKLAPGRIDFGVGTGFTGRRAGAAGLRVYVSHGCPRGGDFPGPPLWQHIRRRYAVALAGGAAGPWVTGVMHDVSDAHTLAFWIGIALSGLSAVAI